MQFPPPRRPTARGAARPRSAPPRRPASPELDPVPFPGGAEAALEFAAFEKGLLERGHGSRGDTPSREAPPAVRRTPISEPDRSSAGWMLAGAAMATVAGAILLLLSSGLLATGFTWALRAVAPP